MISPRRSGDGQVVRIAYRVAACAVVAVAAAIVGQGILSVLRYRDVFPFYDMVLVDYRYFVGAARNFWIFHDNEHLPLFAMPLFWADLSLFGAQGLFLVLCNLVLAAGIALAPWSAVKAAMNGRIALAIAGSAVIASLMFWLGNRANLTWPKQTHMYLSLFALMPAFGRAAADRAVGVAGAVYISLWLGLATFSFGYGIIGFPCVGVIAIQRRWGWRPAAVLAAAFVACLGLYLWLTGGFSYFVSEGAPLIGRQISAGLSYALMFVAAPLISVLRTFMTEFAARTAGCIGAAAGIVLIAWRALAGLRTRPDRLEAWALLLAMFTLGNAAETAFARAARFGNDGALEYRYILGELPFWIALVLLAMRALAGVPVRTVALAVVGLVAVEAGLLASQQVELQSLRDDSALRWRAAMAALDKVDDRAFFEARIWPAPDQVTAVVDGFRTRRLSMFAWPEAAWLGRNVSAFKAVAGSCSGGLDRVSAIAGTTGHLVEGWSDDRRVSPAASWILLADGSGTILGLAHGGQPRPDLAAARHKHRFRYAGWLGYVGPDAAADQLSAYLVLPEQQLCRLAPGPAAAP